MPLLAFESDLDGSDWRLLLRPRQALGDMARPLLEVTAMAIHQLLASLQLGQSPVTAVALPFSLGKDAALARALFGVPVEEDADWCGLRLPRAALAAPLPLADPESFALAERQCREDWARRDGDGRWADRLRAALTGPRLAHADVAVCARLLATSPRSLHRGLAAEGTRFRDVVDALRHERAVQLLRSGAKLAWVAETLGYSDVANFRRAFRRWTGHAPAALR
jgi:AraC-like DNA-binding protein